MDELDIAKKVFQAIRKHMDEGGTYRQLIYNRLGYGEGAYRELIDGLEISNMIHEWRESKGKE